MSSTKATPRFLPTLTEVVHPASPVVARASAEDRAQLVERVTQRAVAAVQEQLQATLQSLLDEHVQILAQRLQAETERVVRLAVSQALSEENASGS
ncbi:hypothetical protein [Rhodoferax saidenbachensis]|uniref:Uncharacterized protein n=1 Tax=Rhodoferax saidenbachensis TaxID=1484693 RepID=A0A1P8KA12_9BURK|nr:hypothetical protein [Rhodoferax saidenbachensis]APW42846.1 hypothetical protein RS694_10085 [Rhodoferax saidenbachensis]